MTTMVLERAALPKPISSLFGSARIRIQQRQYGGDAVLSPVADCADETDVANAESISNALNAVYAGVDSRLDENLEYAQSLTVDEDW